jgi:hypothetical protein
LERHPHPAPGRLPATRRLGPPTPSAEAAPPGGWTLPCAVDAEKRVWRTQADQGISGYLFSHKALAKVFRAQMLVAITEVGLSLPPRHPEQWVVDCKSVGSCEKALVYLGRYQYRGVLQEKDILACNNGQVTFRYQDNKTRRRQTRTLPAVAFLWLLLRHVLPKGLRRARNFGFLHPNSKVSFR